MAGRDPRSELEKDIDPFGDMLIYILARKYGFTLPMIDEFTDRVTMSDRLPEFARPDPRVNRQYQRTKTKITQTKKKIKRKVSPYQKEFGRSMKKLIKAHPRTPRTRLMKRAHKLTRKVMKK